MAENFTAKQKEVIARKMGYEGPMQGFDMFLNSSPALSSKYAAVTDKYVTKMAKGGMVKKYADGGTVATSPGTGGVTGGGAVTYTTATSTTPGGVPIAADPAAVSAQFITEQPTQILSDTTIKAPISAEDAATVQATAADSASVTKAATPKDVIASTSETDVKGALKDVAAETGAVSDKAQVTAQQGTVSPGALSTAAQGTATQVVAPAERVAQAGEMVSGSAVDMAKAEEALAKSQAETAQGVVAEEATVQGQLNKLLTNFDAGKPPPWAAATMRTATAQMAARGIGASSMAGQAIVQATLEAATPIAQADARVFEQMGLQNLSNRQQMAVLTAQQRAAFIGQEFDQNFQSKVLNAAKISDIANMNFTATQQIALENARLAQTMDLANLNNRQASVMANAATIASMDMANLNNRQQAAVVNAQSFLAMDMKNLDNEQQTTLFKAQQITNAILSDTAAENAIKQFNASSTNQAEQFNANLATQTSQFNTAQKNALNQFNADQSNSINKFNAEAQNQRDQFNSSQRLVIDQANAQWRREISTLNTAATNAANYVNAQNLQAMTLAEYNNATQLYRDQVEMAWSSYEKDEDRATSIITAQLSASSTTAAAENAADGALSAAVAGVALRWALT